MNRRARGWATIEISTKSLGLRFLGRDLRKQRGGRGRHDAWACLQLHYLTNFVEWVERSAHNVEEGVGVDLDIPYVPTLQPIELFGQHG